MSWRERLTAKFVLFALLVYFPSQVLGGIETIRSQYGLSGLLPQNETIIGEISQPGVQATSYSKPDKETIDSLMEDDLDYVYYDEPMGRSLFSPEKKIEEQPVVTKRPLALGKKPIELRSLEVPTPKTVLPPSSVGKCFVEVLTSSLVKHKSKVPLGNGSNPSLSVIETCCPGYEVYVHDKKLCIPVCEKPCVNGFCVKPNVCECFPDHVRSLNNDCVPTCPIGCLNGHCYMNGTCSCNKGYVLDLFNSFCRPYCSQPCGQFANCTAPETCSCMNGYRFNAISGRCEHYCQHPCGNGDCTGPNVCSCFSGFRLINKTCQANCSRGCENGKCVANEVCACDPGWVLDPTGSKCLPYCPKGCQHGNCVAPGKCSCSKGYHKVNDVCKPHCPRGCPHGKCTAPDVCTCNYGYEKSFFGTRCKKIKHVVYEYESKHDPIYNPVVVAVPAPKLPIYQPPIYVGPQPYPPPIYNPPISAEPAQVKPIFNAPLEARPSAPGPSPVGQGSIYEKQPAYNPFYQPANPTASSSSKSNYLERQPAFNPNFKADVSPPRTTIKPTTHKTTKKTSYKTTQNSIFSFDFWGSNSKSKTKASTTRKPIPKIIHKVTTKSSFSFDFWGSNSKNSTKPSCSKTCLNGKCTGKNECTCNSGYKMAPGSHHKCVAYCSGGCTHGTCTSPGFCTCNFGYKKKHGKCVKS